MVRGGSQLHQTRSSPVSSPADGRGSLLFLSPEWDDRGGGSSRVGRRHNSQPTNSGSQESDPGLCVPALVGRDRPVGALLGSLNFAPFHAATFAKSGRGENLQPMGIAQ